ncbi:MAG: hypothetical protein QG635_428, partial [Bacteroidota bacterium]|nr:hypothetical protein [Bacteroidota bacterium]
MKRIIFTICLLTLLYSCGPSKEELAREEKLRQDSINLVIEKAKFEAEKNAQKKMEEEKNIQLSQAPKVGEETPKALETKLSDIE